jgi:hypothetical protein
LPKKPRPTPPTQRDQVRSIRDDYPNCLGALHSLFVPISTEFFL